MRKLYLSKYFSSKTVKKKTNLEIRLVFFFINKTGLLSLNNYVKKRKLPVFPAETVSFIRIKAPPPVVDDAKVHPQTAAAVAVPEVTVAEAPAAPPSLSIVVPI